MLGSQTPNPKNSAVFCLVVGASGAGKTTYLRHNLDRWESLYSRVVVLDARGQFSGEIGAMTTRAFVPWLDRGRFGRACVSVVSETEKRIALAAVWRAENLLLCVDEMQLYGDAARFLFEDMQKIVTEGRSYGLKMISVCQRPQSVPKLLLTNLTDVVMLRTNAADGAHLVSRFGREVVDLAATLQPLDYLHAGDNPAVFAA